MDESEVKEEKNDLVKIGENPDLFFYSPYFYNFYWFFTCSRRNGPHLQKSQKCNTHVTLTCTLPCNVHLICLCYAHKDLEICDGGNASIILKRSNFDDVGKPQFSEAQVFLLWCDCWFA